MMSDLEERIKRGKRAITIAKEQGKDTSQWENDLARMESQLKAQEVAKSTYELISKQGWCFWKCEIFDGDTIVIADDFAEPEDLPTGYVVYTVAEIEKLFSNNKSPSHSRLKLIQEAKKLTKAIVTEHREKSLD